MKINSTPPLHLTYCLNVHPGETWTAAFDSIRKHTLAVRDSVAPGRAFGLGMRLGVEALGELAVPDALAAFKRFLDEQDLYVFTMNGFPYGTFHGARVKEKVYAPDWRTPERVTYTCGLADVLADLLPDGESGSISTVPGSYKSWIRNERDVEGLVDGLVQCASHLARLERRTGREIHLGLEPEPDCYIETTGEAVGFFTKQLLPRGVSALAGALSCGTREAERLLRRHVGVCLDTCHVAVQFEALAGAVDQLAAAGIRLSKVQLSAALETQTASPGLVQLEAFREPVYLHQTRTVDEDGAVVKWVDLDEALVALRDVQASRPVRVHFHVPLFWGGSGDLGSTSANLSPAFFERLREGGTAHLEIETYTFDVLPLTMREGGVARSVVAEYEWILARTTG